MISHMMNVADQGRFCNQCRADISRQEFRWVLQYGKEYMTCTCRKCSYEIWMPADKSILGEGTAEEFNEKKKKDRTIDDRIDKPLHSMLI